MEKLSFSKHFQKSLDSIVTNEEIITIKKDDRWKAVQKHLLFFVFATWEIYEAEIIE